MVTELHPATGGEEAYVVSALGWDLNQVKGGNVPVTGQNALVVKGTREAAQAEAEQMAARTLPGRPTPSQWMGTEAPIERKR